MTQHATGVQRYGMHVTEIFWTNPQYGVTVLEEDDKNQDNHSTLIACLTQNAPHGTQRLFIGIYIFKASNQKTCYFAECFIYVYFVTS